MTINRVPERIILLYEDKGSIDLASIIVIIISAHLFFGLITSAITSSKGYQNNGTWFIAGLIFGLIGVISAAFQPNLHYTNSNQPLNYNNPPNTNVNNNVVFCRTCGSANNSGSKYCKDCGSKLE